MIDFQDVIEHCRKRGFLAELLPDGRAARARLAELIPQNGDLTTGGSQTLYQIGFMDDIDSGKNGWVSRRTAIRAENNVPKREHLRSLATTADIIVGSVNALTLTGVAVCIDHGGTRVGAYCYGANHVIWVVGRNKIVPTLEDGLRRAREHVYPLEAERVQREWGIESAMFKTVIIEGEHRPDRIRVLLVDEDLGY